MKTQVNKWFRWGAAGAFGLMLTLNVMVGLEFDKDKLIPTLTLMELGNQAIAQNESGDGDGKWFEDEQKEAIFEYEGEIGGMYRFVGIGASFNGDRIGTHYSCGGFAIFCDYDEPYTELYQ